jgi:hypothetical protein
VHDVAGGGDQGGLALQHLAGGQRFLSPHPPPSCYLMEQLLGKWGREPGQPEGKDPQLGCPSQPPPPPHVRPSRPSSAGTRR